MALLELENIRFVPSAHRRVTFAEQVRRVALEWRPEVIAVELPDTLAEWIVRGVLRLPQISAVCWTNEADTPAGQTRLRYLAIDPCEAVIEAVRLGAENQIPVEFIDLDLPGPSERHQFIPDDLIVDKTGLEDYVAALAPWLSSAEGDWRALARECRMARRLRELAGRHGRVLCVLDIAHFLRVRELLGQSRIADPRGLAPMALSRRPGVFLTHLHPRSLLEVLGEIPYVTYLFERSREDLDLFSETGFDKLAAVQTILKEAETVYRKTYRARINLTQWKALLQYTRNLALVRGRLRPDFYELIVGARGVVDGDFGYEVYELARSYPLQADKGGDLPRLILAGDHGLIEGRENKWRVQPLWPAAPAETIRLTFRRRPSKAMKHVWREQWQRSAHVGICSWPPEDEIQEKFMDFIRKRALQVVTEDRKQVQEFSTSLLDGLDIRETVRNWHTGKLYVQTTPPPLGRCGAVVLVFADEPLGRKGTWRTTLYAENQNESDISFYATPLGEHVVGPRICRTEFGGILSIYPSTRIPDIWSFGLGGAIRRASEALLSAAILFSPDRYIAYVAARPPRRPFRDFARANRKHIVYLPLHMFSASHLKRVRRFHILS
ncbi:MAG: hypothetical protein M1457_10810, partial [bacterium]|nr:hypothetical protein [bacterium]